MLNPIHLLTAGLVFIALGTLLPMVPDRYYRYWHIEHLRQYNHDMKVAFRWIFVPFGAVLLGLAALVYFSGTASPLPPR